VKYALSRDTATQFRKERYSVLYTLKKHKTFGNIPEEISLNVCLGDDDWKNNGVWLERPEGVKCFLILSFRRVLYVICFLLGNSPASEF